MIFGLFILGHVSPESIPCWLNADVIISINNYTESVIHILILIVAIMGSAFIITTKAQEWREKSSEAKVKT